ncbi:hypothetical protein [Lysobacter terrae]
MRRTLLGIALAAMACVAHAQSPTSIEQRLTAEEMHEAGLDTLTPSQLAALNRLLREKVAPAATPAIAPAAATPGAPRSYIGLEDKPIRSKVKGPVAGWEPGTVFHLENGQQWKVLKGEMKLRKPLQNPEIVVIPGFAGRWFLQVDEDMPKARVYRID